MVRERQQKFIEANGCTLAYVETGAPSPDRPTLFFVHATGFHSRVWDFHIDALADFHCIALDQRGHGKSDKLAVDHWRTFAEDQAEVIIKLGLKNAIGIGHSMGGHGLVEAAAKAGGFASLLLLDPTISSPESYADGSTWPSSDELHPAAKRRNRFASADEMHDSLKEKSSFPLFHPQIFRDYCDHAVEPDPEGGVRLCCEPVVEAHVYMAARSNPGVLDAARGLDIPVTIVRAKEPTSDSAMDWASSPTWPGLVDVFPNAIEHHWADCTHFIPMERPGEVVALLESAVGQ